MYLVHPKKYGHGKWEVAWTWLPFFLAADQELVKHVDQELTKEFKGTDTEEMDQPQKELLIKRMHTTVVNLIVGKYPIPGLLEYLEALRQVKPDQEETKT